MHTIHLQTDRALDHDISCQDLKLSAPCCAPDWGHCCRACARGSPRPSPFQMCNEIGTEIRESNQQNNFTYPPLTPGSPLSSSGFWAGSPHAVFTTRGRLAKGRAMCDDIIQMQKGGFLEKARRCAFFAPGEKGAASEPGVPLKSNGGQGMTLPRACYCPCAACKEGGSVTFERTRQKSNGG